MSLIDLFKDALPEGAELVHLPKPEPREPTDSVEDRAILLAARALNMTFDEAWRRLKSDPGELLVPTVTEFDAPGEDWLEGPEDEHVDADGKGRKLFELIGPVLGATAWKSNAEMIVDMVRLGYLQPQWTTIDPTFGRGIWWKLWQPDTLVKHDKYTLDGVDFRELPHEDGTFDAAVFDPAYVATGGKSTSTLEASGSDFNDRYGLHSAETRTPAELRAMNHAGLTEVARVVKRRQRGKDKPKGLILVKTMPYISSATLQPEPDLFKKHAESIGLTLVDEFVHLAKAPRMQPAFNRDGTPRVQKHARRNYSMLLVFQKR